MSQALEAIIQHLQSNSRPQERQGMSRFGIAAEKSFCVRIPVLRSLAKAYKNQHDLAMELFALEYRETRILATMIADPRLFTTNDALHWMEKFSDWELVDQACFNLFWRCDWAYDSCFQWSSLQPEFCKRTPFSLMAKLAVSDKRRADADFEAWFPVIERECGDGRNFVRKAVNWSLRQIGKRNSYLLGRATLIAQALSGSEDATARWIGNNALREFEKVTTKFK